MVRYFVDYLLTIYLYRFLPAAIGFPVLIILLVPIRTIVILRMSFTREELAVLDAPAASTFTMGSVGDDSF